MAEKKKLKVHYALGGDSLCGRHLYVTTDEPKKVTCNSCLPIYTKNKKFYSNEKRKRTLAAKARNKK